MAIKSTLNYSPNFNPKKRTYKKIKILKYNQSLLRGVDYIFLGAWNFKNEIILFPLQQSIL